MPIYKYKCQVCQVEVDKLLPMANIDKPGYCVCGKSLERQMTTMTFVMAKTGKATVQDTLNREYKTLPPEQVRIMAPGLEEPPRPVTGRGF